MLHNAKEKFKKNVLEHGIESWRYKARIYWLSTCAKHASILKGGVGKFKSFKYTGTIGVLFQETNTDDNRMLLENDQDAQSDKYPKPKFADNKKDVQLGTLKYTSLLAYASAVNDHIFVMWILKSKVEYKRSADCDYIWDDEWKKTWNTVLWNAAYKRHELIVKELILKFSELYSPKHYSANKMHPPLHVAVRRGHYLVVDASCTRSESNSISCHEEFENQTLLEVATNHFKDKLDIKKKIQSIFLQRPKVKQAVEESYTQRGMTVDSTNAIMVGAALIASVTYAGWLQTPLGYYNYYQFTEPVPGASDAPLTYMFVQGLTTIRVFAISNSVSFFFAIAAIVAGMETTCLFEELEEAYITKTVKKLQYKLNWTRILFIASVIFVLIVFSSAAIAILPPIKLYQRDIYITIVVGGFICLMFIFKMLFFSVSKCRHNLARCQLGRMFTNMK